MKWTIKRQFGGQNQRFYGRPPAAVSCQTTVRPSGWYFVTVTRHVMSRTVE